MLWNTLIQALGDRRRGRALRIRADTFGKVVGLMPMEQQGS
jgi:hypothetical protein